MRLAEGLRRIRILEIGGQSPPYKKINWQVLTETNESGTLKAWYAYGNYIDEVLMTGFVSLPMAAKYYVHDHLYSPAALVSYTGRHIQGKTLEN
jgi:hypothetical protein